ncbi:MAG TPA: hypothetical protein PKD53_00780 [Chloroflexaceae bacterium]|nr:hypothetical protein [Chloroflexaceae bacterium]
MALIALPCHGQPVRPPLTLAYVATLLEQRRHIVRIYDLGLEPELNLGAALQPLRSFRPQVVVVSGDRPEIFAPAVAALHEDKYGQVLPVPMSRSGLDASPVCSEVLQWLDRQNGLATAGAPPLDLDALPLPARHLLPLESYNLRAAGGELQTTLLVGALEADGRFALRSPTRIVAELRSVSAEFGLRHYLIADVPVTLDRAWLVELLTRLCDANLGIGWEASADPEQLDADLVAHMARAGCEGLFFQLDAASLFESTAAREALRRAVTNARQHDIFLRANLKLEPPYESIPQLVDVAATFGLDDVHFDVARAEAASVGADETQLREMARQIYDQGRDRQRLINRFGAALGSLIWRLRGPRPVGPDEE